MCSAICRVASIPRLHRRKGPLGRQSRRRPAIRLSPRVGAGLLPRMVLWSRCENPAATLRAANKGTMSAQSVLGTPAEREPDRRHLVDDTLSTVRVEPRSDTNATDLLHGPLR